MWWRGRGVLSDLWIVFFLFLEEWGKECERQEKKRGGFDLLYPFPSSPLSPPYLFFLFQE